MAVTHRLCRFAPTAAQRLNTLREVRRLSKPASNRRVEIWITRSRRCRGRPVMTG
jgi:hypothetical protein